MTELKQKIIACLKEQGADLVGFGNIHRFEDTIVPKLMPNAKTVICAAFRVLRGSHRGIENGSTYYQYTTMAVETIEENVMPVALLRACAVLDDAGYAALPQRRHQTVRADVGRANPEVYYENMMEGRFTEPALDYDQAAVRCGLGEIGLHGGLLTDEFGPLVRLCAIITDAEIPEDILPAPHLCDHCGECQKACPGHAVKAEGGIDDWQCAAYYVGSNMSKNPFLPPYAFDGNPMKHEIMRGEAKLDAEHAKEVIDQNIYYPGVKHGYIASICGRACHRACYIHLETEGKLSRTFVSPLRRRPEWVLPFLDEQK